jgi:branched-chain amino acid transport system ATP-binding protein
MSAAPLLAVEAVDVSYGQLRALRGVSISVAAGEKVAIIGANGAGKSTLLRAICGLVPVASGRILFAGEPVESVLPHERVLLGTAMVPEGRRIFHSLSVEENLRVAEDGARVRERRGWRDAGGPRWSLDRVYGLFPVLRERARKMGTQLSGGQQQMLAIGRALLSSPRLLLFDELSLGLAPVAIQPLYAALTEIHREGVTLVLVEQDVQRSLAFADRVYCLQTGRVKLQGRPADFSHEQIRNAYFGV